MSRSNIEVLPVAIVSCRYSGSREEFVEVSGLTVAQKKEN